MHRRTRRECAGLCARGEADLDSCPSTRLDLGSQLASQTSQSIRLRVLPCAPDNAGGGAAATAATTIAATPAMKIAFSRRCSCLVQPFGETTPTSVQSTTCVAASHPRLSSQQAKFCVAVLRWLTHVCAELDACCQAHSTAAHHRFRRRKPRKVCLSPAQHIFV
jgi:hypothetical protein